MDEFDFKLEFNEEDLNDPSLLAELAELVGDEGKPVPVASREPKRAAPVSSSILSPKVVEKQPVPRAAVPVEATVEIEIPYIPQVDEDIGELVLTDADMNDPALLNELMKVTGNELAVSEEEDVDLKIELGPFATTSVVKKEQTVPPSRISTTRNSKVAAESLESKLKLTNVQMLQQYAQIEKVSALNKKRAGDKEGAMESLRNAKELQKRIDELVTSASLPPSAPPTRMEAADPDDKAVIKPKAIESHTSPPDLEAFSSEKKLALESRCLDFKKSAVTFKKAGDMEKAKEMLAVSKNIQAAIDTSDASFQLPDLPAISQSYNHSQTGPQAVAQSATSTPASTTRKSNATAVPSTNSSSTENSDLVNHLISTLDQQITLCTKLSAQYFSSNQKDLALDFHKRKKNLLQDKETLVSMKSLKFDPNAMPFRFNYSVLEYNIAQSNPDLTLDQAEISVSKGVDIMVKGEAEAETGVTLDFGWPSTEAGTLPEGKFETKTAKGMAPEYNFKAFVKIERTKAFQRFLERRKVNVEIFHQEKSFFGIMSSKVVIGKAVIKLDDLLTKCEIHQFVPMCDPANPRRMTGGKVEIFIKLRVPLLKTDVVKTSQKWLEVVFGSGDQTISTLAQIPTIPTTATSSNIHSAKQPPHQFGGPSTGASSTIKTNTTSTAASTSSTSSAPKVAKVAPPPQSSTATTAQQEDHDIDDMEHAFLNPDNIASNAVLESEHQALLQRIAASPSSEELLDLKSGYEIKMQMLVTAIQLGTLDMPKYLGQVKAAILATKTIAVVFKKNGRIELAKQAMSRIKIMTAEVEEVEANQ